MGMKSLVKQALTERENKKYHKLLQQRQMTYARWCQDREDGLRKAMCPKEPENQKQKTQEYVLLVSDKGVPAQHAAELLGTYFTEHPEVQLVYGDEDVWENYPEGERCMPWFKPDWSPHLFRECFYFGGLTAVRREFYDFAAAKYGIGVKTPGQPENTEIFVSGLEKKNQRDMTIMVSALVEEAGGYEPGCRSIGHLPEVLFHRESREALQEVLSCRESREALQELLSCRENLQKATAAGEMAEGDICTGAPENAGEYPPPLISIIIPSKDHPAILSACLKALPRAAGELPWEVIVVDNGSSPENQRKVRGLLEEMQNARYLCEPMEFHFSRMCNLGAKEAGGDFLLFLNDDVELCTAGSVGQMYGLAKESFTGAVGMKLYYPGSVKIQHAGVTNLPMGPVHKLQFLEDSASYYFDSNRGNRNVLAVTAACLMVEKRKFQEAGGFAEDLRVAFNDVELCFKLWELGYANVCMNGIYAYHHESLSRGDDESEEKLNRLLKEREILYAKHPALEGADPYYSVHLSRRGLDTRIRPAFETAGNILQEWKEDAVPRDFAGYRQDKCLLVRVESVQNGEICGYCVVLGDDNACYEKHLLLRREEDGEEQQTDRMKKGGKYPAIRIEGQYRPDLTENMPDQKNAGLSGFWIKLPWDSFETQPAGKALLPQGRYRIGAAARNRVTGTKLINWTNHFYDPSYLNIEMPGTKDA